jgi:alkylation response protein AidB-like acyl-CoA dehydrogenase
MRGTGSNAISVDSLVVDGRFATSWWAPLDLDRPLYRISVPAMAFITTGAVALGVLAACLTATVELIGGRVSRADGVTYHDKPRVQEAIADSEAALRSLRAGFHAAMADLWDRANELSVLTPGDEGPALTATFHAIDGARAAVSRLYLAATPLVYARTNLVERSLRDIYAISVGVEALRTFNLFAGRRLLQGG